MIVGALAAVPFIQFAGAAVIAVGATASIYLSYLQEPGVHAGEGVADQGAVLLGGWGKVVNVVAILWGRRCCSSPVAGELRVDPNAEAPRLRIISNPKPIQTDYYVEGDQLVDFKIDFLNGSP